MYVCFYYRLFSVLLWQVAESIGVKSELKKGIKSDSASNHFSSAPTLPITFEIPLQLRCNSNEKKGQLRVAHLSLNSIEILSFDFRTTKSSDYQFVSFKRQTKVDRVPARSSLRITEIKLSHIVLPITVTSIGTLTSPLAFRNVNSYLPVSPRFVFSL